MADAAILEIKYFGRHRVVTGIEGCRTADGGEFVVLSE